MKKHNLLILFLVAIFCSGIFLLFTSNTSNNQVSIIDNGIDNELGTLVLGDVEKTINVPF